MSNPNSDSCYIFTDTETTGLNITFDQIIQVGSILTDEDIKVLDTQDIGCSLLPWILPSPDALLVHKKTDCLGINNKSHYEMMHELREKWLEWSVKNRPIYITYNGHRFDEELFRRQFFWCLLPSYITNMDGATRLDMLSTFQVIANFFPNSLNLPLIEGRVSMKLTDWAEANEVSSDDAHDALADCNLMVELSKKVIETAPLAWKASIQGASKQGNLDILQSEGFAMMGEIVRRDKFTYPITFCGQNRKMNNEVAVADLYFDPDELDDLSDSELLEQIALNGSAIKKVRINKSMPIINYLDIDNIENYIDIPISQLEDRALKIKNNTKLQSRISDLLTNNQVTYPPHKYLEQTVYSGFASESDSLWMERFNTSPWEDREKLIEGFDDSRYTDLAERLLCSNRPEFATELMMRKYDEFLQNRLYDEGPWLTLEKCKKRTSKLLEDAEGENKNILTQLSNYLESI
ncbi:MAG: exonuclease domain-containing protein [SAR86 cluster bacterium]|nr:exonuclease domain-containing protein [SAR86 cluster bacterium]